MRIRLKSNTQINTIRSIKSTDNQIQKWTNHTFVDCLIYKFTIFVFAQRNRSMHKGFHRFSTFHLKLLQKFFSVLLLINIYAFAILLDWSPKMNLSSHLMLISNSFFIGLKKSLHKDSLVTQKIISSTWIWIIMKFCVLLFWNELYQLCLSY